MVRRQRLAHRLLLANTFSKLMQYLHGAKKLPEGRGIALLTSQNPRQNLPDVPEGEQPPMKVTPKENKLRYRDLLEDLRRMGLPFWKAQGKYGLTEKSVAVAGITPEQALELGQKYDQESVIWSGLLDGKLVHRMLYSKSGSDAAQPVVNKQLWIKNLKDAEDYFTEVGNRKFTIPFFPGESPVSPLPKKVTDTFKEPALV